MSSSIGTIFRLTTFGESHGPAVGGVIDGVPPGIRLDMEAIQRELNRRRPGQSHLTTGRNEADELKILSGVFEGHTTGTPIGFMVCNSNQHPHDYDDLSDLFRPSHADYTYLNKYGIRDHRGGGRASARVTVSRVVAGAIAKQVLEKKGISIQAYTSQVGSIALEHDYRHYDLAKAEENAVRCPDADKAREMEELITAIKGEGDTIGGVVTCVVKGCPAGLGEPEFDKLHALLAHAMMSINAVKGFEYGAGFQSAQMKGSEANDVFVPNQDDPMTGITTRTNHSGGIQGGISNGQDICMRVAFKPVATIMQPQKTVNKQGESVDFRPQGRHDPCVVPRAVVIVEAMAAMVILDQLLMQQART